MKFLMVIAGLTGVLFGILLVGVIAALLALPIVAVFGTPFGATTAVFWGAILLVRGLAFLASE
jgi:hypothetical protein